MIVIDSTVVFLIDSMEPFITISFVHRGYGVIMNMSVNVYKLRHI